MTLEGSDAAVLTHEQYDALLEAAETYREALVVRLCGEVGLRPTELTGLTPGDVEQVGADPPRYLLRVPAAGDVDGRTAYLPTRTERELRRYARSNGLSPDDRVFPVTARRLQMLVSDVADRAADRFDRPALAEVSSSDLRGYFARTVLVDYAVDPRVVKAAGGWGSFEALERYLTEPTDETVVDAFEAVERPTGPGRGGSSGRPATASSDDAPRPRRDALETRYAVARAHRAVTRALFESADHEDVETKTCESLTGGPAYEYAWIDRAPNSGRGTDRRTAGRIDPADVDRLVPDEWRDRNPATHDGDALAVATTPPLAGEDDGERVADDGTIARVPLRYGDTTYGVLSVATDRSAAFDAEERRWLETIGRQVGYAIAAVRRRNLLLSDRVVELEVACRDDGSVFVDVSNRLECRFELDSLVSVSGSTQLYYLWLEGASPAEVFALAADDPGIDDCRLVETGADGCRIEFVVEGSSPELTLTEYGATVLEAVTEDGVTTITAECAADADLRTVVGGLRAAFPDSELVGKRAVERPARTAREFRAALEDRLTDRQVASLRAAYVGGYFDWPRESTAEEVADAMDVSSPTLHNHLRKGQHELLRTFFEEATESEGDRNDIE